MEVSGINSRRFDAALEFLREGSPFTLKNENISPLLSMYMLCKYLILLFFLLMSTNAYGQQKVYSTLPLDKYEGLYNTIFPKSTDLFSFNKHEFAIDIRIRPSFSAPAQVSIIKFRDGKFNVWIYKLANNKESLGDQVSVLLQSGVSSDIRTLSDKLNVIKKEIKNPEFLIPLIKDFHKKVTLKKGADISLDGVGFDIWYMDAGSKMFLSLNGGEEFEKGESSIITWARDLHKHLKN